MPLSCTPKGVRAIAFEKLASLIASCPAFAERCTLPPRSHIYYDFHRDINQEIRPLVIVMNGEGGGLRTDRTAGGARNLFVSGGSMRVQLVAEIADYDPASAKDELFDFLNLGDAIRKYVLSLAAEDDNLPVTRFDPMEPPARTDPRNVAGVAVEVPSYLQVFQVEWEDL